MKEKRRRAPVQKGTRLSLFAVFFALIFFALFVTVGFSTFRLFGVFQPVLLPGWPSSTLNSLSSDSDPFLSRQNPNPKNPSSQTQNPKNPPIRVDHAVLFPDQILLVTNHHHSLLSIPNPYQNPNQTLKCQYTPPSDSSLSSKLDLPPLSLSPSLIRCPIGPQGFSLSLSAPFSLHPTTKPYNWDHLAYTALFEPRDNSTLVFAKGFNLRSARLSEPSRYECLFGWDFSNPKYLLSAPVISAAQEIIRCKTPLTILTRYFNKTLNPKPLVSVRTRGRGSNTLPSIARPETLTLKPFKKKKKKHLMCVCTMVRNQARFLDEWIKYHSQIGIQRWFIYDNNSEDQIEETINSLFHQNYQITLHQWPWVKTQEAGFAHCALRSRSECEWTGFIDVDEFLYFPNETLTLKTLLKNYTNKPWIGELRTSCHSFGPSHLKTAPKLVTLGYMCRVLAPERHKSIIKPELLNPSLINVVHHFHLKDGVRYVNVGQGSMVINHYKYQVWEVFKEKFYRRVATYVADWKDEENVGSKDRAPGLGTKPIEPIDWPSRFCEVNDTGLRDWVLMRGLWI
ncbi:hypothetical protein LUZ60_015655 [Juncus effusus]|nr:hypothetical protein LUZ60_015655 [Juncus effusus]